MEQRPIIFIAIAIIFLVLMAAGGIVAYFYSQGYFDTFFHRSESVSLTRDIVFTILDKEKNSQIPATYRAFINTSVGYAFYSQGTLITGYNSIILPQQKIRLIINADGYYTSIIDFEIGEQDVKNVIPIALSRITIQPNAIIQGTIEPNKDNLLRLSLKPDGYIQGINVCAKWSFNVIKVDFDIPQVFTIPDRLAFYDKCFLINRSIVFQEDFIQDFRAVTTEKYNSNYDFIELVIYDQDYLNEEKSFQKSVNEDIGAPDFIARKT